MTSEFTYTLKEALEIEDHEIQPSDHFKDYEEWDSIGQLSLIAAIDELYEVQIESDELTKINTVQELWEAIQSKVS